MKNQAPNIAGIIATGRIIGPHLPIMGVPNQLPNQAITQAHHNPAGQIQIFDRYHNLQIKNHQMIAAKRLDTVMISQHVKVMYNIFNPSFFDFGLPIVHH